MKSGESPVVLFLLRHGQTDWALSGKHTGRTNIPLNEKGREQATLLKECLSKIDFSAVLVSPLLRAQETATLAGFGSRIKTCEDLSELDYGLYEGLTTAEIREQVPNWTVWTHPCPSGETIDQAAARCRNVIATARDIGGNIAVFAHGHILRILTAAWLDLNANEGRHFMLETGTLSVLAHERETPAIKIWNAPVDLKSHLG
jgi:probable phosphoglycerate mutase